MAVSVGDLEAGTLPAVCAKTGNYADDWPTIEFRSTPGWVWILLLFWIFPFLIADYFAKVRVVGHVPMSSEALRRAPWFRWSYWAAFVVAGLLVIVGLLSESEAAAVGLGVLLGTLLYVVVGTPFFWPQGRPSGDVVWLSFVHKRFAEEMERWHGGI
ncbi:MAG TPA: hypothetical protein VFR44_07665 [Actinomycetota bacterium]|nr:hypothetical protein [Actinomycetota bacterium]